MAARTLAGAVWSGAMLALSIAACSGEGSRGAQEDPHPRQEAPLIAFSTGPASSASAEPPSASANAFSGQPPRMGIGGSTKGTVACGKKRCAAPGEVCFFDKKAFDWSCNKTQDIDPRRREEDDDDIGIACDDGTDCPTGQTCCTLWGNRLADHAACVQRTEVARRCSAELCVSGGAHCPNGRTCSSTSPSEQGRCIAPKGPATCANKVRCPADKPICIGADTGLACVAFGSPEFKAVRFQRRWECTRQDDCHPGDQCSHEFGEIDHDVETFCGVYSGAHGGTLVCDPMAASPCGTDAECLKKYKCAAPTDGPPWLGRFVGK